MHILPQLFLVGAVFLVGVLHTMVPDHWVPITLIARQKKWSIKETQSVAFRAGVGHVFSTLVLGLLVWLGGVALATRFGNLIDTLSSVALVAFGLWLAISAYLEVRHEHAHAHAHGHDHDHHHEHGGADSTRTSLLLILGSSPMVEGIPAFFAASKYGVGLLAVMAIVFSFSTIATYVILCTYSTAQLQKTPLGIFECYGEVLSGGFIALVGLVFWLWPVL